MKRIYSVNNSKDVLGTLEGLKSMITSTKPVLTMLALLMVALFGVNEKAWGQLYGKAVGDVVPDGAGRVKVSYNNSNFSSWDTSKAENNGSGGNWWNSSHEFTMAFQAEESNEAYEFIGWYEDSSHSGNAIDNGAKNITAKITAKTSNGNNKSSKPATITRYAYYIAKPVFYFKAIATTNSSTYGNAYVTFTSSAANSTTDTEVTTNCYGTHYNTASMTKTAYFRAVPKTGYVFKGWSTDNTEANIFKTDAAITYELTSSSTNNASPETIHYYAIFGEKFAPQITGTTPVNKEVGDSYTANFSFTNTSSATPSSSNTADFYYTITHELSTSVNNGTNVISYNPSTGAIQALNAGKATITFKNKPTATHQEAEVSFVINVTKKEPTFSCGTSMKVGENLSCTYTNTSANTPTANSSDNFYYVFTNNTPTGITAGSDTPGAILTFSGNKVYGKNAGTGTITFYQKETYMYKQKNSGAINITVSKNANTLSCSWESWSKDVNVETQTGVTFSSNHTQTPIVVEQKSGNTEGSVIATYSSTNNNITSLYNIGEATWSVSQAENYKYEAAETKTLTVNVVKGSTTCYVLQDDAERSWGTINSTTYGDGSVYLTDNGQRLQFQVKRSPITVVIDYSNNDHFDVKYSADGSKWTTLKKLNTLDNMNQWYDFDIDISGLTIKYIKFESETGATGNRHVRNVRITRKKWFKLEDKDGNEISSLEMPTNTLGGNHTTAKFTVDYSTCADQIKVVSNHPHITVSPTSFTSGGDGTQEITVTYASDDSESIDGVITVYTPYDNKTINVHAETEKKTQEIKWSDLFAGETISLPQTFTSSDAAYATSKLPVVYISGNDEIIEVAADSLSFTVVGTGTTTLTALQKGNNTWKSVSDTKTINASNKKIQRIIWNQQFTRSLSVSNEIPLTATVSVLDVATGYETESNERSAEIVYTCPDANGVIEIFNGTNIRVLGYGNTTITASVAGNEEYEAASPVTLPVRVREIQTGDCDMPLVYEHTEEIEFFQGNTNEIIGSALAINHANGIPDKLSFDVRGAAWKLGIEYYKGSIQVQQSTDNKVHWSGALTTVSPAKGETASSGEIQLDPNATHIRFVRPDGGQGYHYVGNIQITRLPYIRTEEATINLGNISMGETRNFTIPVSYCSVKGNMTVSKQYSDNGLTIEEMIEAECGDMDSYEVQASIQPTSVGPWSNVVTVRDPLSNMFLNVTVNATIQKGDQTITWNPTLAILTTEAPALNAIASSGLTVSYAVTSGNNTVARIDNGQVIILQPGQFTITASQGGNSNYNAAESVEKTFTVTAETLTLLEGPTASDITYGQSLIASTLTGGSVEDSKHNPVTGTFSWQAAGTQPNAGDAQVFAVVFTPSANAAWYNALQTTATVNVAKADPTLSWTSAPTELAYNATDVTYTATSASDGAITYSIIDGSEYASIHSESGALTINVPGNTITIQAVQAEGTNYNAPAAITVDVIIAAAPINEFTNAEGDGDWNNPDNWTSVPTGENPDVIVSGDLEIDGDITVGNLTIENTGSITVITNGTLTVNGTSESRTEYGDIHVMDDGALALGNSADLQVRHFTLDAKLGDADNAAASGQVSNGEKMNINGDVYFQLSFDPNGAIDYGWYDFTVPFPVDINGGIERVNSTSDKEMVCGQDFLLMEDDEVSFVNGGKGWRQISSGVLEPGKLYTITFDETVNQNTFRFAWNGQGDLTNGESFAAQYLTGSDASRNGWNAVGNAMLRHGHIDGDYKIQAYNHTDNTYELIYGDKTFAVGTAFFVQVEAAGEIDWTPAEATVARPLYAPKRTAENVEEFRLGLRDEATGAIKDALFFSASEEATAAYVIGHDLLKKGTPTQAKKAQMWATKGGKNLCDVEATLIDDNASAPLFFYAPQAGTYELTIDAAPVDATLYLTYNDAIIWDLTASPYILDLTKGTTNGYGLRMEERRGPQVTTDIDTVNAENGARKVLIDNVLYIVTPEGRMYDIVGKGIKY